jgi:hypothetical protein
MVLRHCSQLHLSWPMDTLRRTHCRPPRSTPDLNLLDLHLWGHLKTLVCAAPLDNEEALHHRTVDACQAIRNCPGIIALMWLSMIRRVEACIGSQKDILNT